MKNKLAKVKESAKNPIKKLSRKKTDPVENTKLPYITNDTVAEHREEVLADARKYIYPLQHSKHRIVWFSIIIFIVTVVSFLIFSILSLYKFQSTSTFMYRVTQIVPLPVAKAGDRYVSYESYLFELRRLMHYYETQQKLSFDTEEGREQLAEFKKQAMDQVINDAYVKQLAEENDVSVSGQEVDQGIDMVMQQDRLGTTDQMFEDVLRDFLGWSVNDFKRSFRQQLLARKVAGKLDTEAQDKANSALAELKSGADFAEVVNKYSDDEATKPNGGDYGIDISRSHRDIPAQVTDIIFRQEPGQFSEIVYADYSLEIVKTLSVDNDKARAAHVQVNLKNINEYTAKLRESKQAKQYIGL